VLKAAGGVFPTQAVQKQHGILFSFNNVGVNLSQLVRLKAVPALLLQLLQVFTKSWSSVCPKYGHCGQ